MKISKAPTKQGLYDPKNEHDACGIGLIASIKGEKSNQILRQSLQVLNNLSHRGGVGSEPTSGDGAGVLIQLPHAFFNKVCTECGISLPAAGDYGTGVVFLPHDKKLRASFEQRVNDIIIKEGQTLLGWRDVPLDPSGLGSTAYKSMPYMRQVFIGRNGVDSGIDFERRLYIIRRQAEKVMLEQNPGDTFYIATLSSKVIVYKGMLTADQLGTFYTDLQDEDIVTALALVHSRYSTNTFPSWERAHPNRWIIHNGEINTLRGNINAMHAREPGLKSAAYGNDIQKLLPIIDNEGSDSAVFDNSFEFFMLSGMPIENVMMMMIPEPWQAYPTMDAEKRAFYEYHSCLMEPWDGPAAMGFTDGVRVGAVLDRNGLRPSRYYVTTDDIVILASEVGVLDIPPEKVLIKERLRPGRMLLIDTEKGRIIKDDEIKKTASAARPYSDWLSRYMVSADSLPDADVIIEEREAPLAQMQKAFGYSYEDLRLILAPMASDGSEPVGAMGNDVPLAVLSKKPQLLYDYFKSLFAQVTNPPIDALREEIVTSSLVLLGSEKNLLDPRPETCQRIKLSSPVIDCETLEKLKVIDLPGFKSIILPILYESDGGGNALESALDDLFEKAEKAVRAGVNIIILSDRNVDSMHTPIPALLAVSGLHHHLIRQGIRTMASIVLESGEPREVHHFSCLIGFGASAVNPYLALQTVRALVEDGTVGCVCGDPENQYLHAASKGVIKTLSKMGISTVQSYMGAQIFEAIGLSSKVVDRYFTSTLTPIEGMGLGEIARESDMRHALAFDCPGDDDELPSNGMYQYRRCGEYHLFNPETIHKLQKACRNGDYNEFKEYSKLINATEHQQCTLRSLMRFKAGANAVPIEEVEPVESICKRFKTGAMSFGSLSREAHETLAIAMNRIGGKSNTGEGGEDPARYVPDENGDSRCSAVKQVASGRFGVTSEYLVNSKEIQIKMAQGAKPGEGGQLPGRKVYPEVAKVRYSTPGVGLISPPPHHDIYSIEDLKQLIFDLKNANPAARINVKLVSEAGVGTVAAGVAKGMADVILISGYDGGTGASPRTSMRHVGLPWELGLAETQQTLILNHLRSRVVIETDGKLLTGRDVAIAALLGADEYGFATAPLVTMGCVMMRICNLDTCPVGIATQNPRLRGKFAGDPQHVINFMRFIAQEMREIMASLGFKTVDEMIGRSDMLETDTSFASWKAKSLDLTPILYRPELAPGQAMRHTTDQDHELERTLDMSVLHALCKPALEDGASVYARLNVKNTDRAVGTILGSEVSRKFGSAGLPEDTIKLHFQGSSGQSFGAFLPKGITLILTGDSNDYIGKGLSGGKIIVKAPACAHFSPDENTIIGNVAFYGATCGEAYIGGAAGERFCVRNSGAAAVVEAVGDHGCEYMTGGRVAVLGGTGRNFAAGMSGGIAYVYDGDDTFANRCNLEMVDLCPVDKDDEIELRAMIDNHLQHTGSVKAAGILSDWEREVGKFKKVLPNDYARMMRAIKKAQKDGYSGDEALIRAFEANYLETTRSNGN